MNPSSSAPERCGRCGQTASISGGRRASTSLKRKADHGIESGATSAKRLQSVKNAGDVDKFMTTLVPMSTQPGSVAGDGTTVSFLSLPAELRLQIYGLLFKADRPVFPQVMDGPIHPALKSGFPKGVVLAMVLANKQISGEVTHFIFSSNSFYLRASPHFHDWLARIGLQNSHLVREITVFCPRTKTVKETNELLGPTFLTLRRCTPNLRQLVIQSDNWEHWRGTFAIRSLIWFTKRYSWKRTFPSLRHLTVKTVEYWDSEYSTYRRTFYDTFFHRTQLPVTGINKVRPWIWMSNSYHDDWILDQCTPNGVVWLRLPEMDEGSA
ncbi:hypothetical protein N657DRAFT_634860 [Parathielavia appendiculata]|uniref:Uncharacterized protein n=1 Tax=Parathielavia appendiculata TaxID=2587402 RepID=A0AAN6TY29_9PEZI|nr:hypothetical protein N657DRAFT_634860 [Parathielavia appendiculata]